MRIFLVIFTLLLSKPAWAYVVLDTLDPLTWSPLFCQTLNR